MGGGSLFWSLFSRNCRKAGESKDGGNGREAMEGATACGKFGEECPGMDSECLNCSETLQGGTETALVLKDQKLAIDLSFWICSCKSASPPALPGQNHVVHFFLRMLFFR